LLVAGVGALLVELILAAVAVALVGIEQ